MTKTRTTLIKPIFILLLSATLFRLSVSSGIKLGGYDEQLYNLFMNVLNQGGVLGIRSLIQAFPYDDFLSKGPLPFRILFIFIGSLTCKISGFCGLQNLAFISFISGILLVAAGFILFRYWLGPVIAFFSTLLIITSPLQTALSSRALQDSFFALIVVLSIIFYHRSWLYRKKHDLFLLGVFVLAGLLTKESMLFMYPCFGLAAIYYRKQAPLGRALEILIPLAIAPVLSLAINCWIAGSFFAYLKAYLYYAQMQGKIQYNYLLQQGPWFIYIVDFLLLSPLAYIFSIIGLAAPLSDERNRQGRRLIAIYALGAIAVFSLLPILNVRFILFVDVLLRGLAIFGILFIAGKIKVKRTRYVFIIAVFLLLVATDIYQYYRIFVSAQVYDPVHLELMRAIR